jgi:putative transposase
MIQKYMRYVRPKRAGGQNWKTFLRHHAAEVWACDFWQVTDLFFRPLFAFFLIERKSRKVMHVNVTRSPTDPWVARTAAGGHSVWTNANISASG